MKKTCITATLLLATVTGVWAAAPAPAATQELPPGHPTVNRAVDIGNVKVAKATDPNAKTVEEIVTQRADLKDKPVVVRGKVVKFNPGIMGKNWVHLRDGTGAEDKNTNDILVTTQDDTKPGDVVTISGTVRIDKDFGSGYAYDVLVEDATIKPDAATVKAKPKR
jgi:DNA/RNA endonuclease YhcR with UshA esterase domain